MSTKLNTNLNAVELTQDELNFVTGGMSATQAQMNAASQANAAAQMNAAAQNMARRIARINAQTKAASKNVGI